MAKQIKVSERAQKRIQNKNKNNGSSALPIIIVVLLIIGGAWYGWQKLNPAPATKTPEKAVAKTEKAKEPKATTKKTEDHWWKEDPEAHRKALKALLPSDYSDLAKQRSHSLGGMKSTKEEIFAFPFLLGPTGILARKNEDMQSYTVISIQEGSPAEGKIKPDQVIIGANQSLFSEMDVPEQFKSRSPNYQMGQLILDAEANKSGRLVLRLEGGRRMRIDLPNTGGFRDSFPENCPKMEYLALLNARILAARQNPDGSWGKGFYGKGTKGNVYTTTAVGLALMATGEKEFEPHVEKAVRYFADNYEQVRKKLNSWGSGHVNLFLGEYYLKTGDKSVLPAMKREAEAAMDGSFHYSGMGGWGHSYTGGNYRYGGINVCSAHALNSIAMAKVCGIEIDDDKVFKYTSLIQRLAPDGALGYAWTAKSRGEITSVKHNENAGRTGTMAIAAKLLGAPKAQYDKMTNYMFLNGDHAECGHATAALSLFWAHAAMTMHGGDQLRKFARERLYYLTMARQFDGGFYLQPGSHRNQFRSSDGSLGPNYMNAAMLMLLNWHKHSIFLTGKDYPATNPQEVYSNEETVVSSSRYYARKDLTVEIAEAMNLLGKKTPKSVKKIFAKIKVLKVDDNDFANKAKAIYDKYLEAAVKDIMAIKKIDKEIKSRAALAMIGVNYSPSRCSIGNNNSASFRHYFTLPNSGSIQFSSKLSTETSTGVKLKSKSEWNSPSANEAWEEFRKSDRYGIKLKFDEDPGEKFTLDGKTLITWNGIHLFQKFTLSFPSEGEFGKWSPSPEEICYGPFTGKVLKCTGNGSLQIEIAPGVIHESSMMSLCQIHTSDGETVNFGDFKGKIEIGTKVRFSYFNRGGGIFAPMASDIWLD